MPNSVNLVLKKNVTASGYVKPYDAAKAVDGLYSATNPLNRWLCNGVSASSPATLLVDLGAVSVITRWVVRHMSVAGWPSPDYNMSDFKLQVSLSGASGSWVDVDVVTGNASNVTDRNISALVIARYVRLYITKGLRTNPQLASIMEFEVYGYATPYLSGLTINNGQPALNPSFAPLTFAYTANVGNAVTSITLTPTAEDSNAKITVNGTSVKSGTASAAINLNVGTNTIPVVVTAADNSSSQTYTITVVRASSSCLTNLVVKAGRANVTINPTFDKNITAYTASVAGTTINSVSIIPTAEDSSAEIKVNGVVVANNGTSASIPLSTGANTITVTVTSNIGKIVKTYTIAISK